jgi:hypothetical protein
MVLKTVCTIESIRIFRTTCVKCVATMRSESKFETNFEIGNPRNFKFTSDIYQNLFLQFRNFFQICRIISSSTSGPTLLPNSRSTVAVAIFVTPLGSPGREHSPFHTVNASNVCVYYLVLNYRTSGTLFLYTNTSDFINTSDFTSKYLLQKRLTSYTSINQYYY